ncbi:hypothetical protein [Clostridium tertium]|uniref:hypothetical protein n=1 Tax=Clostridium tertium TaxID=1559 RepID=UPI001AEB5869|nr:hypothetical protein [Clostridium tertium]MBP1867098.1 hypothetical protein [Clostridium tertium]
MFIIGESINPTMVNNEKNAIDFERYCKDERLSSIEIRSEVYKSSKNKRNKLLKEFIILIRRIF